MIRKCKIRIELLSDMCVSDGSAYNSMIDTDICSDRYGFPFIPAKRLRGCLRECALELNDWGDAIDIAALFGDKGDRNNRARLRIGNAYLENYEEYRSFVTDNKGHVLTHPQNVLGVFSYTRTQTSINYDTGVADDNSLRTVRVANKGLVFIADADVDETFIEELERCCRVLRHMGVARTRGLGEVQVTIEQGGSTVKNNHGSLIDGACELNYEIDLKEPVICKSVNGGESNTADYIEGSKILGLISEELSEDFIAFMGKGDLKCLNAYISSGDRRFTEVPGYIYKIKNNGKKYVNKLAETKENSKETETLQLNQMKHCYAVLDRGCLRIQDVMTEERYHHRRPEDKSIGRAAANEDGDADFYQMDSISEGQKFMGKITGSPDQISEIYRILTQEKDFYIGYSRSSEYGRVRIHVIDTGVFDTSGLIEAKSVVVSLNAPAIIYNEKAMPTTDPDAFINELLAALNIKAAPASVNKYIRNITIGGYNVTWNMRKPTLQAFDKGTSVKLDFEDPVMVPDEAVIMLGERTAEGYGEAVVSVFDPEKEVYVGEITASDESSRDVIVDASSDFSHMLAEPVLNAFIRRKAVEAVNEQKKKLRAQKDVYKPTISNMMLMAKESSDIDAVRKMAKERYSKKTGNKEAKGEAAKDILSKVDAAESIIDEFSKETGVRYFSPDINEIKMMYLKEYLNQIKYLLRGGEKNE